MRPAAAGEEEAPRQVSGLDLGCGGGTIRKDAAPPQVGLEEVAPGLGPDPVNGAEQHDRAVILGQAGRAFGQQRDQGRAEALGPRPSPLDHAIKLGEKKDEPRRPRLKLLVSPAVESSRLGGGGGMEDSGHARRAQGRHRRKPREAGKALTEVLGIRAARSGGVPQT